MLTASSVNTKFGLCWRVARYPEVDSPPTVVSEEDNLEWRRQKDKVDRSLDAKRGCMEDYSEGRSGGEAAGE